MIMVCPIMIMGSQLNHVSIHIRNEKFEILIFIKPSFTFPVNAIGHISVDMKCMPPFHIYANETFSISKSTISSPFSVFGHFVNN